MLSRELWRQIAITAKIPKKLSVKSCISETVSQNARAKGRKGGRKPGLSKESKQKAWNALYMLRNKPEKPVQDIQKELGISKGTCYIE